MSKYRVKFAYSVVYETEVEIETNSYTGALDAAAKIKEEDSFPAFVETLKYKPSIVSVFRVEEK